MISKVNYGSLWGWIKKSNMPKKKSIKKETMGIDYFGGAKAKKIN